MWEQNWGGVCSSRYAFSSAMSIRTSSCSGVSWAIVTSIGQLYCCGLGSIRSVANPQTGIFALGTASHAYLELDLADEAAGAELVATIASMREPRTTMGGVN